MAGFSHVLAEYIIQKDIALLNFYGIKPTLASIVLCCVFFFFFQSTAQLQYVED